MNFLKNKNYLIAAVCFISSLGIYILHQPSNDVREDLAPAKTSLETHIPAGHVLIPIEIKNSESLDSLFGNFGKVNLYAEINGRHKLIAKYIKLVRAPLSPDQFAVLVKEEYTEHITQYTEPFFVSLSHQTKNGTVLVNTNRSRTKTTHIEIGVEDAE